MTITIGFDWGRYTGAVERWERILGRPAPAPVDDQNRLAPEFPLWMQGFPEGWVDGCGLTRTQKLKGIGNAVQPQNGYRSFLELVSA